MNWENDSLLTQNYYHPPLPPLQRRSLFVRILRKTWVIVILIILLLGLWYVTSNIYSFNVLNNSRQRGSSCCSSHCQRLWIQGWIFQTRSLHQSWRPSGRPYGAAH